MPCRRLTVLPTILALLLSLTLGAIPAAGQTSRLNVATQVRDKIAGARLSGASITCQVVEVETGDVLASVEPERAMIPASNLKLITSGTALLALGTNFSFETHMLRSGDRLIIVGSGDPALADPELLTSMQMSIEAFIDLWIEDVLASGMTEISELIVDDRIFDRQFVHSTWEEGDLLYPYGAQVSGFNYFGNCLWFYAWPARQAGQAPTHRVEPDVSSFLRFRNEASTTVSAKATNQIYVVRPLTSNEFAMRGTIRRPQAAPMKITVHDPPSLYAQLFAQRLRQRGVKVAAARTAGEGDPLPFTGEVIGRPVRTPIGTILTRCNQDSDNLYAEALIKRIGHDVTDQPGSWTNGAAVARLVLSKHLGPAAATQVRMIDGSGLSRENRVTAGVVASWLAMLGRNPQTAEMFRDSLALAGENGTLRKRFGDRDLTCEVRAKSGYISGVSCLSGYVTSPAGRSVAFSVLVNDIRQGEVSVAKKLHEDIVAVLDRYLSATDPRVVEGEEAEETVPQLGG